MQAMTDDIDIRPFSQADAAQVRDLFVTVNRLLASPDMQAAFEHYIVHALHEEIDRIDEYYREHNGGFWVAVRDAFVVAMFGLEKAGADAMELRRMYVVPELRRTGIGRLMLRFAENECRRRGFVRLVLSTSELQRAAVGMYRRSGYVLVKEVTVETISNRTVGGGVRRFHFEKDLRRT